MCRCPPTFVSSDLHMWLAQRRSRRLRMCHMTDARLMRRFVVTKAPLHPTCFALLEDRPRLALGVATRTSRDTQTSVLHIQVHRLSPPAPSATGPDGSRTRVDRKAMPLWVPKRLRRRNHLSSWLRILHLEPECTGMRSESHPEESQSSLVCSIFRRVVRQLSHHQSPPLVFVTPYTKQWP